MSYRFPSPHLIPRPWYIVSSELFVSSKSKSPLSRLHEPWIAHRQCVRKSSIIKCLSDTAWTGMTRKFQCFDKCNLLPISFLAFNLSRGISCAVQGLISYRTNPQTLVTRQLRVSAQDGYLFCQSGWKPGGQNKYPQSYLSQMGLLWCAIVHIKELKGSNKVTSEGAKSLFRMLNIQYSFQMLLTFSKCWTSIIERLHCGILCTSGLSR